MNRMEEIRKIFNSKQAGQECEIVDLGLQEEPTPPSPAPVYSVDAREFLVNSKNVLLPSIFCNRKYKTKIPTASKKRLVVFENMLSNVAYAYYNSSYDICAIMRSISESVPTQKEPDAPAPEVKKKRGRKKKIRTKLNGNRDGRAEEDPADDFTDYTNEGNLLDYLVSPLKFDFEFG